MDPIDKLRNEISEWEFLSNQYRTRLEKLIDRVEFMIYDDLVSVGTVAQMLELSERQVHNLAADPTVNIWKYNTNGTRKTTNRKTKTCYRVSEVLAYKEANR